MEEIKEQFKNTPISVEFYTNKTNMGMLGNINRCVELADTEYIAFLHDDDLLLPNYIQEIEKEVKEKSIDCLIPARYIYYQNRLSSHRYTTKTKQRAKDILTKIFILRYFYRGKKTKLSVEDNIFSLQNIYAAPSCGTLFRKKAILDADIFGPEGTMAWDFLSFLKLNRRTDIILLHKPLGIYREYVSASLRPEVMWDFYTVHMNFFLNYKGSEECNKFLNKYKREIAYILYHSMSEEAKIYVEEKEKKVYKNPESKVRYYWLMIRRIIYYSMHNLDAHVQMNNRVIRFIHKHYKTTR